MYKILLVEDEPAAQRYLRSLIERKCPDFSVAASAGDGVEALEQVRRTAPDLIVTDVKMPKMDGIDLVVALRELAPRTPVVIVSGYQEFDWVRRALNTGVVDYLLKPVAPRRLSDLLAGLRPALERNRDERALARARTAIERGATAAEARAEPEGPQGQEGGSTARWHLALLRGGGPASRDSARAEIPEADSCLAGFCRLMGRDRRERLLLAPTERLARAAFLRLCAEEMGPPEGLYETLLVAPSEVPEAALGVEVRSLSRQLDRAIVLGLSQTIEAPVRERRAPPLGPVAAARIEHAVLESLPEALVAAIREPLGEWGRERLPSAAVEAGALRLLQLVERSSRSAIDPAEIEARLRELIFDAGDFEEFSDGFVDLALLAAGLGSSEPAEGGATSLFESMRSYVEAFYARSLTASVMCQTFRISPSYLGRLFRRHAGRSFNEFLRACRIEAAKRLIRESPTMAIKSVARYVGFHDPFYFSRVFRSETGVSPTEFGRLCAAGPPGA